MLRQVKVSALAHYLAELLDHEDPNRLVPGLYGPIETDFDGILLGHGRSHFRWRDLTPYAEKILDFLEVLDVTVSSKDEQENKS